MYVTTGGDDTTVGVATRTVATGATVARAPIRIRHQPKLIAIKASASQPAPHSQSTRRYRRRLTGFGSS